MFVGLGGDLDLDHVRPVRLVVVPVVVAECATGLVQRQHLDHDRMIESPSSADDEVGLLPLARTR
jgi:hypothetical protein